MARSIGKYKLTGQRFGEWQVVSPAASSGRSLWNCICDCGTERVVLGQGLVTGRSRSCGHDHYRPHGPLNRPYGPLTFEDKYIPEPNSGCWIWLGAVWKYPYGDRGKIFCGNATYRFAYRVAYELFVGPIPDGLLICHKCDTPICVNPDHLFAGTHSDNMQDMIRKGRAAHQRAQA